MTGQRWLLLLHQIPTKPAYFRVKIWRRLSSVGAVAVKGAVYALPGGEQYREDFEWLLKEIVEGGGEAMIWEANLVGGISDNELRDLFNAARDDDYAEIGKIVRSLMNGLSDASPAQASETTAQLKRLKTRRDALVAIDFFGANGREAVDGMVGALEEQLSACARSTDQMDDRIIGERNARMPSDLRGRTWVTRQGVHVDRIASAWLIRRFIDSEAQFKFAPAQGYMPTEGELRFDMFEAEFTHEGDLCTFEVLLSRMELPDPALAAIGQIVHDIDLKDTKFGREEAAGIRTLIAGICASTGRDEERIARGAAVFEDLFDYFRKQRG